MTKVLNQKKKIIKLNSDEKNTIHFSSGTCVSTQSLADGIEFFKGDWEEALALAKAEEKVIFVDAFAVWCGPCKRMSAQVFPKKK